MRSRSRLPRGFAFATLLAAALLMSLASIGCRNTANGVKADTKKALEKTGNGIEKTGQKIENAGK